MEQRRKRAIDEKSKHIHNRQRREQELKEYDHLDHDIRRFTMGEQVFEDDRIQDAEE